jgi:next to BRCA1 gene 1 protein
LSARFLCDNTVPDGQKFPPGAEFVKSWKMLNDGERDWPETTELVFAAGESLSREDIKPQRMKIGSVPAGDEVNVGSGELKVSAEYFVFAPVLTIP